MGLNIHAVTVSQKYEKLLDEVCYCSTIDAGKKNRFDGHVFWQFCKGCYDSKTKTDFLEHLKALGTSFSTINKLTSQGVKDEDNIRNLIIAICGVKRWDMIDRFIEEYADATVDKKVHAFEKFQKLINHIRKKREFPYKGLSHFDVDDEDIFFGRDAHKGALTNRIIGHSLTVVVGPSGSGKSSLVFAGAVPMLRELDWEFITVRFADRKDGDPFKSLAIKLIDLEYSEDTITEKNKKIKKLSLSFKDRDSDEHQQLIEYINQLHDKLENKRILIVFDQFEELFTNESAERLRDQFIFFLLEYFKSAPQDYFASICITIRRDYLDSIDIYQDFAEQFHKNIYSVGFPTIEDYREIITRPLDGLEVKFEDGLEGLIIDNLRTASKSLPLLSFALEQLWQKRSHTSLTLSAYLDMNGLQGALEQKAEAEFNTLSDQEKALAKSIFFKLVSVRDRSEKDVKRLCYKNEFTSDQEWPVVQKLAKQEHRPVVIDQDKETGKSITVELVHEKLITQWTRLTNWLDEDREHRIRLGRFCDAVTDWADHNKHESFLPEGPKFEELEKTIAGEALTTVQAGFVNAAIQKSKWIKTKSRIKPAAISAIAIVSLIASLYLTHLTSKLGIEQNRLLSVLAQNYADRGNNHIAASLALQVLQDDVENRLDEDYVFRAIKVLHDLNGRHILTDRVLFDSKITQIEPPSTDQLLFVQHTVDSYSVYDTKNKKLVSVDFDLMNRLEKAEFSLSRDLVRPSFFIDNFPDFDDLNNEEGGYKNLEIFGKIYSGNDRRDYFRNISLWLGNHGIDYYNAGLPDYFERDVLNWDAIFFGHNTDFVRQDAPIVHISNDRVIFAKDRLNIYKRVQYPEFSNVIYSLSPHIIFAGLSTDFQEAIIIAQDGRIEIRETKTGRLTKIIDKSSNQATPIFADLNKAKTTLLLSDSDGIITEVDRETQKINWTFDFGSEVFRIIYSDDENFILVQGEMVEGKSHGLYEYKLNSNSKPKLVKTATFYGFESTFSQRYKLRQTHFKTLSLYGVSYPDGSVFDFSKSVNVGNYRIYGNSPINDKITVSEVNSGRVLFEYPALGEDVRFIGFNVESEEIFMLEDNRRIVVSKLKHVDKVDIVDYFRELSLPSVLLHEVDKPIFDVLN